MEMKTNQLQEEIQSVKSEVSSIQEEIKEIATCSKISDKTTKGGRKKVPRDISVSI